jgi:hypothetical protein
MEVTFHPAPRWRDVVLEQVRIVGPGLRIEALVTAAVLAVGTFAIGMEILGGGSGFDSDETFPTALISFLFPFALWRREKLFGADFLWTLPVDRRRMALAKVFAGWVWLMAALAFFASWLLALTLIGGAASLPNLMRIPLTATIVMYLFGSALVLGLRHPLRWLLGAAGVFMLLGGLSDALEPYYGVETLLGSRVLFWASEDAWATWRTLPALTRWAITAVLGCGAGMAALWAAASRHRERKRP